MTTTIFRGAGCNGPSLRTAVANSVDKPSKDTVPAGATWPFVSLSFNKEAVSFSMANIRRDVTPESVERVDLNKTGYIFFRNRNGPDFGFATLKTAQLLKELRESGYKLDGSCKHNLRSAKISLTLMTVIPTIFLAVIITMAILKPNGV